MRYFGYFTHHDSKQRGLDFLRFLTTEQIQINGQDKNVIRKIYDTRYTTYRTQFQPDEPQVPFAMIVKSLFQLGRVHLQENKLFSGEAPPEFINSHHSPRRQATNRTQGSNKSRSPGQGYDSRGMQPSPHRKARNQPSQGKNAKASSPSSDEKTPERKSENRIFKRKNMTYRVAVDQHLMINRDSSDSDSTESYSSAKSNQSTSFRVSDFHVYTRKVGNIYECVACLSKCTSRDEIDRHLQGKRHRLGVMTFELRKRRSDLVRDKDGIQILCDTPCADNTFSVTIEEKVPKAITFSIKNNSSESCEMIHCDLLKRIRVFYINDKKVTLAKSTTNILPGGTFKVKVKVSAKNVGTYHTPIAFHFNKYDDHEFHIIKFISAKCVNSITESLKPVSPYKRQSRKALQRSTKEIVDGYPLPKLFGDNLKQEIELNAYFVPQATRHLVNSGLKDTKGLSQIEKVELTVVRSILEKGVEVNTYVKKFQTLMHFEEIQMEYDIRKYDMEAAPMKYYSKNKRLLTLQVPGLAENRPSVLKGDRLYVRINNNGNLSDKEYRGYVHDVQLLEVVLGFHDSLLEKFVDNMKFNVRFEFNRLPVKLQHRACELAHEEGLEHKILFPDKSTVCSEKTSHPVDGQLRFFQRLIETNEKQQIAVKHITLGTSRPSPYIVFGPPGTGKTFTIVEAIKQVWKTQPKTHILACTPSNSAADLIAERLLEHIPGRDILRFNASSRSYGPIPGKVKEICNYSPKTGQFFFAPKQDIMKFRIVISTLVTAGRLASANFPSGHFSHVIVDEAGHAVEPELLIGVAGILNVDPHVPGGCGQLVLAGDPQQLGPVLRSPFAIKYGLDKSLLERYMNEQSVYAKPYDERIITKLLKNYRSHPAILKLPNEMFYDGELQVWADEVMRESLCDWEKLPRPGFPVMFHGVTGQDQREERSPSFFNAEEVSIVWTYVNSLLTEKKRGIKVKPKDIGIISPYRKQVQKLQQVMREKLQPVMKEWKDIQIGSVEEFQGQEKKIIIVSTVRSNPEYLSLDMDFKLGFLRNPKRFNVTMTRAKALLIVVGNPITLSHDDYWKRFIQYCKDNQAYVGEDFEDEDIVVDDIIERLDALQLSEVQQAPIQVAEDSEEEEVYLEEYSKFNDQPWRSDM